ncbi:MAG: leucyl aminopeptidase, partial [Magnetospirillum sp.]|nr:leucyl aminopeptidase [Magnetospirillum sp.]
MKISFAKPQLPDQGAVIVGVLENKVFSPTAQALDDLAGGGIARAVDASKFTGKKDQTLTILAPVGTKVSRVVLVGLG